MEIVVFVDWCRREKTWAFSTTKGCVAAISAFWGQIEGYTVFMDPAMHEYLQGAKRLDVGRTIIPDSWDPSVVLHAPEGTPFEPLDPSGYEMGFIETRCLTSPHHCRQRFGNRSSHGQEHGVLG